MRSREPLSKFKMSVLERRARGRAGWGAYIAQRLERKQRDMLKHGKTPQCHRVLIG